MNIDKRFEKLGFTKVEENKHGAWYTKPAFDDYSRHKIEIIHKSNGKHLIFSFVGGSSSEIIHSKYGLNDVVGLTEQETKLALKKLKALKRKYKWNRKTEDK